MFWDYTGDKVVPNIAKGWEMQDGGRTWLVHLRRGMKWSDGQPFTADDFMFWFEDIYQNKDLYPTPSAAMAINGKQGTIEKVDEHDRPVQVPEPYYMFPDVLAGSTDARRPRAQRRYVGMGGYAPAHYLKQFHPEVRRPGRARQEGQGGQVRQLGAACSSSRTTGRSTRSCRSLSPWKTVDADQHADLDAGAQPVQRLGRHRGQPAAVHRQGRADAGREPGGAQPARHRRRVRLPGSATSTSASCRSSWRTSRRATTRSTSTPATTAAT